jgi:hypothetical protein
MKSKRDKDEKLKSQIEWAETLPDSEVQLMLLDGKSKTKCGCTVYNEALCPHGNMGALQLLFLQLTNEEIAELEKKREEKPK